MKITVITLLISLFFVFVSADDGDKSLTEIHTDPTMIESFSNILDVYLAEKSDIDECRGWNPTDKPKISLKEIVTIAESNVERPTGIYEYTPPELRGIDMRFMGSRENPIWYFEVFFGFEVDTTKLKGLGVRDGGTINSVRILANGGVVVAARREMSSKERIQWGLDIDPDSDIRGPFQKK